MEMTWGQLGRNLFRNAKQKRIPISGQFELTARCNLQCKMCYVCRPAGDAAAIRGERTAAEWIAAAEQARKAGMLFLLLTGGEVFLRKDFLTIYSELADMGFHINIYTNATLIDRETAKILGNNPPSKMGITIYGATPEMYGMVCGNTEGYARTMRGIDLLQSEGIKLNLKMTVIKRNVNDFDVLAEYADRRGLDFGTVNYITPRREGCGTCPEEERLPPAELIDFRKYAGQYFSRHAKPKIQTEDDSCNDEAVDEPVSEDPFRCAAGKCAFWITWDGRMTPCPLMDMPSANPFEIGIADAWREIQRQCAEVPFSSQCEACAAKKSCNPCPARLKMETGFFDQPAPYLCSLAGLNNGVYDMVKEVNIQ